MACGSVEHLIWPLVPATDSARIQGTLPVRSDRYWLQLRRIGRHLGVDAGHDLQQRANRIDDLALRFGAAARQIDHFGMGAFGTVGARIFKTLARARTSMARWQGAPARSNGREC